MGETLKKQAEEAEERQRQQQAAAAPPAAPASTFATPVTEVAEVSEDDFKAMKIGQLKEFIGSRGGSYGDCVEKSDLIARALQVQKQSQKSGACSDADKDALLKDFLGSV